ncbi:HD-GYP domain-containing protein [Candidatus Aerophobetes bacterium]|nr:HD-GYP domain-containing protein [Candidatus Aerophobetes bacterium]
MEKFELLRALIKAKNALSLFPEGHPMIQEKVRELLENIEDIRKEENQTEITIIGEELFINGHSLRQESLDFASFIREIVKAGINRIAFQPGITSAELILLLNFLNERQHKVSSFRSLKQELQARGITHILLNKMLPVKTLKDKNSSEAQPGESPSEYEESVSKMEDIFEAVLKGASFSPESVHSIVHRLIERTIKDESTLRGLFNIKTYDDYTFHHSVNVALLGLLMGKRLGINGELLSLLGEAALLHDIGKIMIPEQIITKPDSLNPTEWEIISRHPVLGAEILSSIPGVSPITPRVALEHHIRCDGSGYPSLKVRRNDNHFTQIVSICDFYDALTTIRPYRTPMFPHQAILLMLHRGKNYFNMILVKLFISVVGFFPVGTVVRTNRREVGMVTEANPDEPLHPVIKILEDEQGRKPSREPLVDTSEKNPVEGCYLRNISMVFNRQAPLLKYWLSLKDID